MTRHDYLLHTNHPKTHCGCANKGLPSQFTQEYHIWNMMNRRCSNPTHQSYDKYGGRGITVCDQWKVPDGFEQFLKDVGPRPGPEYSIDRKESDGNYEPGNVKWSTDKEQARNKRNSIYLPHPETGAMVPAAEVAEFLGIAYQAMRGQYIREGRWPTQYGPPKPEERPKDPPDGQG
jgi:hypothetical protein